MIELRFSENAIHFYLDRMAKIWISMHASWIWIRMDLQYETFTPVNLYELWHLTYYFGSQISNANAISVTETGLFNFAHFEASLHADSVCGAIVRAWVCAQRDSLFFNCFLFVGSSSFSLARWTRELFEMQVYRVRRITHTAHVTNTICTAVAAASFMISTVEQRQ